MAISQHLLEHLPRPVFYTQPAPEEVALPGVVHVPGIRHETLPEARTILANNDIDITDLKSILAVIRNPYDLEVSRYSYLKLGREWDRGFNQALAMSTSFSTFAERSTFHAGPSRPLEDYFLLDSKVPGNLLLVKYENLASDLPRVLESIGVKPPGRLEVNNSSNHGNFRRYMTVQAEAAVYNRYRWAFDYGLYERLELPQDRSIGHQQSLEIDGGGAWRALTRPLLAYLEEGREAAVQDVLAVIADAVPGALTHPDVAAFLEAWGIQVSPTHFYSPIPDTRHLELGLWEQASPLAGVRFDARRQIELVERILSDYSAEVAELPREDTGNTHDFYLENGSFGGTDAFVLYCMIRHFRPARIIEVGSGYSTRLIVRAADRYGGADLTCIEPFPDADLATGRIGVGDLLAKNVQSVPLSVFEGLEPNDLLFIDSSHVAKIGSDVNYLVLEVLPNLNRGVLVHFHDIFLPWEYPREWVMRERRFWNEQYLVHAFLVLNDYFDILAAMTMLERRFPQRFREAFPPNCRIGGGSLWLQRIEQTR
jgi:hypothetical protein